CVSFLHLSARWWDSPSYIASICALNFWVAALRFTLRLGVNSPDSIEKSRSRMVKRFTVSYDGSVAFNRSMASCTLARTAFQHAACACLYPAFRVDRLAGRLGHPELPAHDLPAPFQDLAVPGDL